MKITFIGDIFPADEDLTLGLGIKSKFEEKNGTNWKEHILSITKGSEIVVGNLESPLLDTPLAKKKSFYGNPGFAGFLKDSGINVLHIANNHILEHGALGYEETLKTLKSNNIGILGNNNNLLYLDAKGCKIGIAGFSSVDLDFFENKGCFSELNQKNIEFALNEMAENNVDLKIFCFHWGNEYIHKPSMEQRTLAYELVDAGVHVIIGHHPHVIQPYEKYKNGHIFYSLGNFCFSNPFQSRQFSKGMGVSLTLNIAEKSIQKVELFGIQLVYEDLMRPMRTSEFDTYFKRIQKKYHLAKDNDQYAKRYEEERKRRRLTERILMKLSLVRLYFHLKHDERKLLLRNLKQYYSSHSQRFRL